MKEARKAIAGLLDASCIDHDIDDQGGKFGKGALLHVVLSCLLDWLSSTETLMKAVLRDAS